MRFSVDCRKIVKTPVSRLLRGQITGPACPLEHLDTSQLSPELVQAIRAITDRLTGRFRLKAARQLVNSCGNQLMQGRRELQIIAQLAAPETLASLIRSSRSADWVLATPFPSELWPLVERTVCKSGIGRRTTRRMIREMVQSLEWQLEAGKTAEMLALQHSDAVVLGNFIRETHSPGLILEFDLPDNVLSLIHDVVRRTRLWPAEKSDVARELAAHFSDGLEKGMSAEEMINAFGPPVTAARLIRRAQIRNRPISWYLRRRSWQLSAVALVCILILWSVAAVRFMEAEPTVTFDLVAEFDETSREIPETERAWPVYRRGLTMLTADVWRSFKRGDSTIRTALREGPEGKNWDHASTLLKTHADAVDTFLEATDRPNLGFIFRDPENLPWLWEAGFPLSRTELNPPGRTGFEIQLPQLEGLALVFALLEGEFHLATEQRNAARIRQVLSARVKLARHYRQAVLGSFWHIAASFQNGLTAQLAAEVVIEHTDLFTDRDLEILLRELAAAEAAPPDFQNEFFINDFLQRTYSDDGNGNGHFTPHGMRILQRIGFARSKSKGELLRFAGILEIHSPDLRYRQDATFEFTTAPVAAMFADRQEMQQELLLLQELLQKERIKAITLESRRGESEYVTEYQRLYDSLYLRLRFLPALILVPSPEELTRSQSFWTNTGKHQVRRDAALVVIAAELYRRQQGQFPETAEQLVPDLLPAVPVDPYTSQPLRYLIKDGRPVVDSAGLKDET